MGHALCASRVGLLDGYKLAGLRDDARNTVNLNKTKQNKKGKQGKKKNGRWKYLDVSCVLNGSCDQ